MKLPNADKAIVGREKIVDYLLNAAHPDNGGKAAFFAELGFRPDEWGRLASALKTMAAKAEEMAVSDSPHGRKYVIAGCIQTPAGKTPMVRTIWIVDKGRDTARLVTAYPRKA